MKPTLQLRLGTSLTMTPQLQQAIQLLQLSTLDLRQEIQQALESNPMLELDEEYESLDVAETQDKSEISTSETNSEIPEEYPLDSDWSDLYQDHAGSLTSSGSGSSSEDGPDFDRNTSVESLQDHLRWQLAMTDLDARERQMAESLIDAVDGAGYLSMSLDELVDGLRGQGLPGLKASELEQVLLRLQQFDPTGVFARDLRECLLLQLALLPDDLPLLAQARRLVRQFLEALGNDDRKLLKRRLSLDDDELDHVIRLVRALDPRPASAWGEPASDYVIPDLLVRHTRHGWQVELNPEALPKLRIQPEYAALIKRADKSADNTFLKDNLQEARWLMKSLSSRNDTLLKVGREIMARQIDFLEQGEEGMKPLILANIAEVVEMHESTISRVTTQKYIHTPRGVFELKFFFSSQVGGSGNGDAHSSTAIRARIRKLISEEPARKPLSDSRLVDLLASDGIEVARRTVAKYREAMGIPSSSERKRLA
ncbi:RNA polymerase factor sigma-54 [Cobetia marina]|jgi:RNA polymerase sigma-54 factor|uniref:RNA polymerase sigma-54 factor n=1 Tax=Cobetia marina TaxID=28258 RepID=A0ABU9GJ75_COBMA|nr:MULTISPECIES: RNA polymerase factor sigma-54 [Cobetia]AOM02153.1 RNA polymerase factor sigma-54 [Cobetia marina]AZV31986.1 RNA polymerase factor sigma-54 [Cobetia sp. ICG0124]MDA5563607.1 RNA polymerase factor sigma-54 [Cobetia sp. MMG027]MDH2290707.1 RNA polymerase factor sigma-54 [Cobetia sp. 10Alg 146]MDH2372634.1 RNA polymerase factor sigma-54 [Cobetia sp. 3AK]